MAQPIKPFPTLYGKDADKFVEEMLRPATKEEKENIKRIRKKFEGKEHLLIF
jgi:hypothetical protein